MTTPAEPVRDAAATAALLALAPLPSGYGDLLRSVYAACVDDPRIRAAWLGGSVARGEADAGSDLDVLLAIDDDSFDEFACSWRDWLAAVSPTLLAQELPGLPGSFAVTTLECLRLDVVAEPVSSLETSAYRTRLVVMDHDGLAERVPLLAEPQQPDPSGIRSVVDEFYRQQAIFPAAVVARADWLLGVVAVHQTQLLLYQLFVACNAPLPAMGVKQWSSRLTPHQRAVLAGLLPPTAECSRVVAAMLSARAAFREHGRGAVEALGVQWPLDVDAAVDDYWRRLGL